MSEELFAGYSTSRTDEAVGPDGRVRPGWVELAGALEAVGVAGLAAAADDLAARRRERGIAESVWVDGRQELRPVPMDPVPRPVDAGTWAALSRGVTQRHRALNAFLADAYRPAGRRRGDTDRAAEIVRAGVLPEWAVAHAPGRDPAAIAAAWPGQPRAALAASDVVRTADGRWVVARDVLQGPSGIGYALTDRESARAVTPALLARFGRRLVDPAEAVPLLRAALAAAAPPACPGAPRIAVLTQGESDGAWFEHQVLAEALRAPLVRAADLWPRRDGGVEAAVDGGRLPVDVLYRRFDDALLGVFPTGAGVPLDQALTEAVRAGRLGVANVPGNGVADDAAGYAWVPEMIRFYLGEEPLLPSARTWVLADPAAWTEVRDRLHELDLEEVAGYGGRRVVHGPGCSAAEVTALHAEIAAAPHRFVAREPLAPATVPALVDGVLRPRSADLRVFSVAAPTPAVLPVALTRVAPGDDPGPVDAAGSGSKDTWLLR
ncbi:circularly permuted type 2 ATP-grasp protein [Blastococcus xanthinilyticus]|uniref:Putative circularly permuted ATP-grasp superfamily protein n=1 Tax=Blastococcus xanthinilyticus TaxID=1564164 RepID=A0A5S5CSQ1_9ACTN|nr:circularly permuted type 2 ATP-grasp protein [Blastococcus xanthinilyticus]TYP86154.1 putative circularly permuted ATP-grasp superfamily protein [Blastococcus xanthinilyticus]